jgi:SAM-dependent methyltransferase
MSEVPYHFEHSGHCPACDKATVFRANSSYFRNSLRCEICQSVPRQRVLMYTLSRFFPKWRELAIHEGSPGWDIVSRRLVSECPAYIASQFDVSVPFGSLVTQTKLPCKAYKSENLEAQSFADGQFDLVLTQDVFEHIYEPDKAIREIARTLKPGGATLMTVPIVMGRQQSRRRAKLVDGKNVDLLEPQFHGSPLGGGSLVTVDWGFDLTAYLHAASGLNFIALQIDNIDLGIRAELNEVLVGFKRPLPLL